MDNTIIKTPTETKPTTPAKTADSLGIIFHVDPPKVSSPNENLSSNVGAETQNKDASDLATINRPNVERVAVSFGPGVSEKNASHLGVLRTYKGDIEDVIKTTNASSLSIAIAENNRRAISEENTRKENEGPRRINKTLMGVSALFILLGIVVGFMAWYFSRPTSSTPNTQQINVPSIISPDLQKEINLGAEDKPRLSRILRDQVDNDSIRLNFIEQIYLTEGEGINKKLVSTESLISILGLHMSDALIRSLDSNFMFGIHSYNRNQPFFIFKTRSYETAFSSMLSLEKYIAQDLQILFALPNSVAPTLSSFEPSSAYFEDMVIRNKDVRVFKNRAGEVFMMYSLPDKDTIIITTNEYTLKEVLSRLALSRVTK